MVGEIESLRASGNFASPRESGESVWEFRLAPRERGERPGISPRPARAGRGRRAKRGGRGARLRERALLPLSLALSPLPRGEGIADMYGMQTACGS